MVVYGVSKWAKKKKCPVIEEIATTSYKALQDKELNEIEIKLAETIVLKV